MKSQRPSSLFFGLLLQTFEGACPRLSQPVILRNPHSVQLRGDLRQEGPTLYWSDRIGKDNTILKMPKFRTMWQDAPVVATHLLNNPDRYVTPIGRILRKFGLHELPQLYSVLKGDMSFVGPRPALFNQHDLVALRTKKGIHCLVPGVTEWAQINGRD